MRITEDILEVALNAQRNVIKEMEKVENWAVSNDEIDQKINKFLKRFKEINEKKEIDKKDIIRLVAFLYTGNMLNIVDEIKTKDEEFINDLISIVNLINEEHDSDKLTHLFAERLMVIYRMQVIPEIFSKERIDILNKVLEDLN